MATDGQLQTDSAPAHRRLPSIIGLAGGPLVAAAVYILLAQGDAPLARPACATAAIGVLMAWWWITEAIPLAATALLPLVLFPLMGVYSPQPQPGDTVRFSLTIQVDGKQQTSLGYGTLRSIRGAEAVVEVVTSDRQVEQQVMKLGDLKRYPAANAMQRAATPYASPFVFLFMGGFLIALAIERWNLHRRIALVTLRVFGTQPHRLIAGFMVATAGLSMWISNTAATLMMLPIATSLIDRIAKQWGTSGGNDSMKLAMETGRVEADRNQKNFSICLLLGIAYAASIGGASTLVGTPPNVVYVQNLQQHGRSVSFGGWMLFALPLAVVFLGITWLLLTRLVFRFQLPAIPGGRQLVAAELKKLGPVSRGEQIVMAVFVLTAMLWMFRTPLQRWDGLTNLVPWVSRLSDPLIAMAGGLVLFALPVSWKRWEFAMDWKTATKLPWGVLLLFGGGLSLASAVQSSGLGQAIGNWVASQQASSAILWVLLVTVVVLLMTELTSNVATTTLFMPILYHVASQIEAEGGTSMDPMLLMTAAVLAASYAFMLPVATPPNAIVFGTEKVTVRQMARAGLALNLLGMLLIPLAVLLLGPWLLGIGRS